MEEIEILSITSCWCCNHHACVLIRHHVTTKFTIGDRPAHFPIWFVLNLETNSIIASDRGFENMLHVSNIYSTLALLW